MQSKTTVPVQVNDHYKGHDEDSGDNGPSNSATARRHESVGTKTNESTFGDILIAATHVQVGDYKAEIVEMTTKVQTCDQSRSPQQKMDNGAFSCVQRERRKDAFAMV